MASEGTRAGIAPAPGYRPRVRASKARCQPSPESFAVAFCQPPKSILASRARSVGERVCRAAASLASGWPGLMPSCFPWYSALRASVASVPWSTAVEGAAPFGVSTVEDRPHWHVLTGGILQTVLRPVGLKHFAVLPKRWIIERTLAWLARYRHAARIARTPPPPPPVKRSPASPRFFLPPPMGGHRSPRKSASACSSWLIPAMSKRFQGRILSLPNRFYRLI